MSQSKTYRELQFENEHVSVWKTVISKGEPLEMHRHSTGRVVIGLKGGESQADRSNRLFLRNEFRNP